MSKKSIAGAIGSVTVIMIASRLLALLSSQIYMSAFGTESDYINIYSYVINIPNIIFTCIGTALSTVVIPLYVGHRALGEKDAAKRFADNIITVSMLLTLLLVIFGIAISPVLIGFTGFAKDAHIKSYATKALMVVMPVMFFYALNFIFQGMLQACGRYKLPAFVSVPSSLVVIGYVLFLSDRFGVSGLLIATVIGLSLQAIILIPPMLKEGYRYRLYINIKDPDIIKAGKMAIPTLIGVGAYQLNMLFNTTMIARYDQNMVTIINFVQNITIQLVLSFAYSITAVIYPKLTESAAKGDMKEYKDTLSSILKTVSVILIPISLGFISVREPLLNLLVAWGKVGVESLKRAEIFLSLYAIGLIGIGLKEILDRAFYSVKDTKTSAINGFIIMAINIILSIILMQFMGAYGIPLAYSLASISGIINLSWRLRKKIGPYAKGVLKEILKSVIAGLIMFIGVYFINMLLANVFVSGSLIARLIKLFAAVFAGAGIYACVGLLLKIEVIREYTSKIFCRLRNNI